LCCGRHLDLDYDIFDLVACACPVGFVNISVTELTDSTKSSNRMTGVLSVRSMTAYDSLTWKVTSEGQTAED